MTLILDAAGLGEIAAALDALPVESLTAGLTGVTDCKRLVRDMRDCAERYGLTAVHIQLDPLEETAFERSDLEQVVELAERFLAEGELADADAAARAPYVAAIARLKATRPEFA
jgi:hypothetical protein